MRKIALVTLVILTVWSCKKEPIRFSEVALQEQFETIDGKTITFESILEKHKGKTILLTFWATWCSDCRQELPRVKALVGGAFLGEAEAFPMAAK